MADEQQQLPDGSSYLFNADAQAVLEESPSLDIGLELINELYSSKKWDDPIAAKDTAAEYSQQLRYRFEDKSRYSEEDIQNLAPIDFNEVPSEGESEEDKTVSRIDAWEESNLDFLKTTTDPDYVTIREKLSNEIEDYASNLRRESIGKNQNWLADKFYRAASGLTGGIAKLVGAEEYAKNLTEHTNPSADDDFSSAFATVGGLVTGTVLSAAATAPIGGVGAWAYLGATGAGQIKETYNRSLEETGDSDRALLAGAIETGSQVLQTVAGTKIFGTTGKLLAKKILGQEAAQVGTQIAESAIKTIASKAGQAGTIGATGTVISNYANKYGTNNPNVDVFDDAGKNFLVGAVFGGGAGALDAVAARSNPKLDPDVNPSTGVSPPVDKTSVGAPIDVETTGKRSYNEPITNSILAPDIKTADGSQYIYTADGSTIRIKGETGETFHPLDKTFFVPEETAKKLAQLRLALDTEGKPIQILTDGESLLVKSNFIDENLNPTEQLTGRLYTEVKVADPEVVQDQGLAAVYGYVPVEVNNIRNTNGNEHLYQNHIGFPINEVTPKEVIVPGREVAPGEASSPKLIYPGNREGGSLGAAFTKERTLGKRLRLDKALDQNIREGFGDEEFGYARYFPQPLSDAQNVAKNYIAEKGIEGSIRELLSLPENYGDATPITVGYELTDYFNKAVRAARDAGDTKSAEALAMQAVRVGEKVAKLGTNYGQGVNSFKVWQMFDPDVKALFIKRSISNNVRERIAAEENIPVESIERIPRELARLKEQKAPLEKIVNAAKESGEETPIESESLKAINAKEKELKATYKKVEEKIKEAQTKFDPDKEARLKELLEASKNTSGSTQERLLREAFNIENKVLNEAGVSPGSDYLYTWWQANLLSDLSTHAVNISGTMLNTLGTALSYFTTGLPRGNLDGAQFIKGLVAGAKNEGVDAFLSELSGVKTFKPQADKLGQDTITNARGVSSRPDPVNDAPAWAKKFGLNNIGLALRALSAADAFFYKSSQEGQGRFAAYRLAKEKGLKGDALIEEVSNTLHNSKNNFENALISAKKEAKLLDSLGLKTSERQTRQRAWEILEAKRPESVREEAHTFALKSTFNNTPDGVVGYVIKGMKNISNAPITLGGKTVRPLRYLMPFLNVAGNLLNANLDYTAAGLYRALNKEGNLTPIERRNAAGKFIIGTTIAGTLYGLAKEYENDKDPYISVTARGPADANLKNQLLSQGWKPYSIKVGANYYSFKETPLGLLLGGLGAVLDQEKYNKTYARKTGLGALDVIIGGMGSTFVNNSFLKNMADLLDGIRGENGKSISDSLIVNPIKGFVPLAGGLRGVSKLIEDPVATKNDFWAKFVSGIPFVQSIGTKPALNAFGAPVERTLEDRLSFIGRFYSQRVTDPTWRWLADTGYTIPDSGFTLSVEKRASVAKARAAKLGAAFEGIMTEDERYEFIAKSGPIIKNKVNEYRLKYGTSGYQEKVQRQLSEDIGKIRSNVKKEMFLK